MAFSSSKRKRKKYRQALIALGVKLLAVLLVVFLIVSVVRAIVNRSFSSASLAWEKEQSGASAAQYLAFADGVLRYSGNGIDYVKNNGNVVWSKAYTMAVPKIKTQGDYAAIADLSGYQVYIFNGSGETGSLKTSLPVVGLSISSSGTLALVLNDGMNSQIAFYDKNGESKGTVMSKEMSVSGYPMDLALSPDGIGLVLSVALSSSGVLKTQLLFYNFREGRVYNDDLVGTFVYDGTLFPQVEYLSANRVAAIGDDRLCFFSLENVIKPELKNTVELSSQLQSVCAENNHVAAVLLEAGGTDYVLNVYDADGNRNFTSKLSDCCRNVHMSEHYVTMVTDGGVGLWDYKGHLRFYGETEHSGLDIFVTGRRRFVQFDGNCLYCYKLK